MKIKKNKYGNCCRINDYDCHENMVTYTIDGVEKCIDCWNRAIMFVHSMEEGNISEIDSK